MFGTGTIISHWKISEFVHINYWDILQDSNQQTKVYNAISHKSSSEKKGNSKGGTILSHIPSEN